MLTCCSDIIRARNGAVAEYSAHLPMARRHMPEEEYEDYIASHAMMWGVLFDL